MSWVQTRSGGFFDYDDMEKSKIDIEDISYSLSNICRFLGHTNRFYSVAEHSINSPVYYNMGIGGFSYGS